MMISRTAPYLSLDDVFVEISDHRIRYSAIAFLVFIPVLLWAVIARPLYRSEATIAIEPGQEAAASTPGVLGGLASLAGVSLGSDSRRAMIIATLEARSTAVEFISSEGITRTLLGAQLDRSVGSWRARSGTDPVTPAYAYEVWKKHVLRVTDDQQTGLVTVAVEWYNPQTAADWDAKYLRFTDSLLRDEALRQAQSSIEYLNSQLSLTKAYEVRNSIADLLEQQLKAMTLAKVRGWYALRVIDSPAAPIRKSAPNRTLLVVLGIVFAAIAVFLSATAARLLESAASVRAARVRRPKSRNTEMVGANDS